MPEKDWTIYLDNDRYILLSTELRETMTTTYKSSSKTKRPVVVSIPVTRDVGSLSLKDAEAIVRREGGQPMSEKESKRFSAFKMAGN